MASFGRNLRGRKRRVSYPIHKPRARFNTSSGKSEISEEISSLTLEQSGQQPKFSMATFLAVVVLLLSFQWSQSRAPTPPKLSETFQSKVRESEACNVSWYSFLACYVNIERYWEVILSIGANKIA